MRARFLLGCLGIFLLFAGPIIRLIGRQVGTDFSSAQQIGSAALMVVTFGAVAWFQRNYLRRHAVTRAAATIFLAVGVTHLFLGVAQAIAGVDPGTMRIINCLTAGVACLVFGCLFERGMLWSGLVFFLGGLLIATEPNDLVHRNLVIIGAGVFFALNAIVVWGPRAHAAYERSERTRDLTINRG